MQYNRKAAIKKRRDIDVMEKETEKVSGEYVTKKDTVDSQEV